MKRATYTPTPEDAVVEAGSGNVFADMGLPDAEEHLAKAELLLVVRRIVKSRGWTQRKAAKVMGIAESDMSDLMRGRLARFSQDRLSLLLTRLDMDVQIRISPKKPSARAGGRISVKMVGAQ
jgi:predicted XRE-type DNA-binding protein